MLKSLRLPICALTAVSLLFAAVPNSTAAYDSGLYKSLLKKIYKQSEDGDAGDIFSIIQRALRDNSDEGEDLVKKLISRLEENLDQLADGVSKDDLKRVNKRLKNYLKQNRKSGNVNGQESRVN